MREGIYSSTTLRTQTPRVPTGTGSGARQPAAKLIFGGAPRRASATSILRPQTGMEWVKTGQSITPRLRHGSPPPSDTWAWPARFRIGPVIPMASICRLCPFAVLITSSRREPKKSASRTCPTAALSSRRTTTIILPVTTAGTAAAAVMLDLFSPPPGLPSRKPKPPRTSLSLPILWCEASWLTTAA